jgi:hypothetical protein
MTLYKHCLIAQNVTRQYNKDASDQARLQFDAKAAPHKFLPNQLVLLDEHSFLGKNQKLAPKWTGPHKILSLKGDSNLEILLKHNNRKTVAHANRLSTRLRHQNLFNSCLMIKIFQSLKIIQTQCDRFCHVTQRPQVLNLLLKLSLNIALILSLHHQPFLIILSHFLLELGLKLFHKMFLRNTPNLLSFFTN